MTGVSVRVAAVRAMTRPTVLAAPDPAAIRDELRQLVLNDLHGPLGGEHEESVEIDKQRALSPNPGPRSPRWMSSQSWPPSA